MSQMGEMEIELAFYDGDDLLAYSTVICRKAEQTEILVAESGHIFHVTHLLEEPASPVDIVCNYDGGCLYNAALRVGVHDSEDWESISLGDIHTLGFRCRLV